MEGRLCAIYNKGMGCEMRVTAADLMMAGWHCGWVNNKKQWAFRINPLPRGITFHEAVKAYKGGMRGKA